MTYVHGQRKKAAHAKTPRRKERQRNGLLLGTKKTALPCVLCGFAPLRDPVVALASKGASRKDAKAQRKALLGRNNGTEAMVGLYMPAQSPVTQAAEAQWLS